MNRIHRKIWSRSLGAFIAVAETTRSRGKAGGGGGGVSGSVGGAWVATVLLGQALAGGWAHAGPQGGQLAAGSGSIAQTGTGNNTVTTITQTSPRMVINWNSFNVGAGESVSFRQPDASAIALNRVLGSGASQFDGSLTANGQVWLLNPSGVLFGRNAQVSGGGLLASTLGLSDASFMAGQYRFSADGSQGSVVNQGSLTGGYVALLGKQVVNSGSIVATGATTGTAQTGGAAMLGAGDAMTLNFDGQRLLNLQVDRGSYQALVDNQGLVQADDGQVRLTAHAKDALLATVVNNSGIVQARGVRSHGGTIELLGGFNGGTVQVGGTLDASSALHDGGFIDTSGARVQVQDGARVSTLAPQGRSGTWLIDPDDFTVSAGSGSQTGSGIGADTLATNLASTSVTLQTNSSGSSGNGDILVNAPVSWNAATRLTLRADRDIAINADITAQHSSGHLVLEYGGAAPSAGNLAQFRLAPGVKVNLQAGNNFSTRLGNDSPVVTWRVITQLGAAGSTTGTDLQGINGDLTGRYVLGGDIDASATAAWNNGEGFAPLGDATTPFTGRLDG
jgi:filamentous hemagglutinin family protein